MTDTSTETEHQESAPTSEQQPAEKTLPQSEVDRIVEARLARQKRELFPDYDDLKTKAERLQEIEDANKTESQKLNDQLAEMQKQLAEKDKALREESLKSLRAEVAATKRVPPNRLHGTTKEELEADAEAYLAELTTVAEATKRKPTTPSSGLKSGASSTGDTSASPQERAAAALRAMRQGA